MRQPWTVLLSLALAGSAAGNERHFTYAYESAVLPPGVRELEVWTTAGLGNNGYSARFDERMEYEVGLTERLQTSLYLNFSGYSLRDGNGFNEGMVWRGVSSEWKYKLSDSVADPLGVALYGELLGAPHELELEAKLILDKRVGDWLFAANLVLENDYEYFPGASRFELKPKLDLGATYFVTHGFSAGVELESASVYPVGKPVEFSALFAGPVVSYARAGYWVALSVLPQLPAFKTPAGSATPYVLTDYNRLYARLLFSFQL